MKPGDILIDDYLTYRHLWEEHGGTFIHHTSAKESLQQLAALSIPGLNLGESSDSLEDQAAEV